MGINQTIYDEIKKNNNMITTSQVLSLGYSKQLLRLFQVLCKLKKLI